MRLKCLSYIYKAAINNTFSNYSSLMPDKIVKDIQ